MATIAIEYLHLPPAHVLTTVHFENTSNAAERDYAEDVLNSFEYVQYYRPGYLSQRHSF